MSVRPFPLNPVSQQPPLPAPVRATMRPTSRGKIVGHHPGLRRALDTVERVASSSCPVLVTGESGTGKELVVAALHDASPRAAKPLVTVNCGAIDARLFESALFGHSNGGNGGANGAHAAHSGFVAAAEGGTLFIDEVGELPLQAQVKLLRLIQHREYTPVGDTRYISSDLRVAAATNRDLETEVRSGRFRDDLYYRLNVIRVDLPALRDRANDIEVLALHFLRAASARTRRVDALSFSPEALRALRSYSWPGNVRTLESVIERTVLLTRGSVVTIDDLPERVQGREAPAQFEPVRTLPEKGIDLRATVEQYENHLIAQALERTGGNKNRAARLLKLSRTTLIEMLKRKGL